MFGAIPAVYLAFYTAKTLEEAQSLIVSVIHNNGGQIRIQSDRQIVAGFGSGAKFRIIGGAISGVKVSPRDIIIDMERLEDKTLIKVIVRDMLGFGSRIGFSGKLQELMNQNASAVKAAFLDATPASIEVQPEPRPDELQASPQSQVIPPQPNINPFESTSAVKTDSPDALTATSDVHEEPRIDELQASQLSQVTGLQPSNNPYLPASQVGIPQQRFSSTYPNQISRPLKDHSLALLLEILPGIFGIFGIGWIYSGNTTTGIVWLISVLIWDCMALVVDILTGGGFLLCTIPINIALVAISGFTLESYTKKHPELFG